MKYVFVCSYGQDRSPSAEYVAEEIAREQEKVIETDCIGLEEENGLDIRKKLKDSDKVFVMERRMAWDIKEIYKFESKVINLDVRDSYGCMDDKLIKILRDKLKRRI